MEIGTAIFLSALALSMALIVVFTRDRVRWGRILGIGFAAVVALSVVGGGVLYVVNSYEYQRDTVSELDGTKLGDSEQDILFKRGAYTERCVIDGNKNFVSYWYDDKTTGKTAVVDLRDGLVQRIFLANELGYDSPDPIAVYNGDSEDRIREKWGKEDFIQVQKDPSVRYYVYRRYKLNLILADNRAVGVGVFNPKYYYHDAALPPERKRECFDKNGVAIVKDKS